MCFEEVIKYINFNYINTCNYCKLKVDLTEDYIFTITGAGKHNERKICFNCMKIKIKQ